MGWLVLSDPIGAEKHHSATEAQMQDNREDERFGVFAGAARSILLLMDRYQVRRNEEH